MTDAAAVRAFISKWGQNTQKESAAAKEHFAELCRLLGVPTPNDPGSGPDTYCFEKSLTKTGGKAGFADVWKRDCFAWEYKGKGKYTNLDAAYAQLLLYKEDLGNPPVLVVCDIANYEVHIAFTGYRTRVERFANAELENASTRGAGAERRRAALPGGRGAAGLEPGRAGDLRHAVRAQPRPVETVAAGRALHQP